MLANEMSAFHLDDLLLKNKLYITINLTLLKILILIPLRLTHLKLREIQTNIPKMCTCTILLIPKFVKI